MRQFLDDYKDKPLIFGAKAKVGTLPFEITRVLRPLPRCVLPYDGYARATAELQA